MSKNLANKKRSRASTKQVYLRPCRACNKEALMSKAQHFCSPECKGKWQYISKRVTTETQYELISGNWPRYLSRLLYFAGRKRKELTRDILLRILTRQNYKCALTGVDMTCNLQKGKNFLTNASVDRIIAGGPYTEENVQLVCKAVNFFRKDTALDDFIDWCQKVVDHNKK